MVSLFNRRVIEKNIRGSQIRLIRKIERASG